MRKDYEIEGCIKQVADDSRFSEWDGIQMHFWEDHSMLKLVFKGLLL